VLFFFSSLAKLFETLPVFGAALSPTSRGGGTGVAGLPLCDLRDVDDLVRAMTTDALLLTGETDSERFK